jgi:hypothetical protein
MTDHPPLILLSFRAFRLKDFCAESRFCCYHVPCARDVVREGKKDKWKIRFEGTKSSRRLPVRQSALGDEVITHNPVMAG